VLRAGAAGAASVRGLHRRGEGLLPADADLPDHAQHLEETLDALGPGYWDYGLERNRHVLETFARYSHEQGLASRVRTAEEIVLASASDAFKV
jgi:hypothetical protein